MNEKADSPSQKILFRGKLSRKALWVIAPASIFPAITGVIGGFLFPRLYPIGQVLLILIILLFSVPVISLIVEGFLAKQIIRPIQQITQTIDKISHGDVQKKANVERRDEIGQLGYSVNQINKNLSNLYINLEDEIKSKTKLIFTSTKIGETSISTKNIDEILQDTVKYIVENFNHFHAAIFIVDKTRVNAVLRAISGRASTNPDCLDYRIPINSNSMIGWSAKYNQSRIAQNIAKEPLYTAFPGLPDSKSEIVIPITIDDEILGILDVQDSNYDAFSDDEIITLQMISNQLAAAIHLRFPAGMNSLDPNTAIQLYKASHAITATQTSDEVFQELKNTLLKLHYSSALFISDDNTYRNYLITDPTGRIIQPELLQTVQLPTSVIFEALPKTSPIMLSDPGQKELFPEPMIELIHNLNFKFPTLFPIIIDQKIIALLFMGSTRQEVLTYNDLEILSNLVDITIISLEKTHALNSISERVTELQTLKTVSQSISSETNLDTLYNVIHQQIIQVMGNVNFSIALYNPSDRTIEIPYIDDGNEIRSIPPFPLGEGLTSIIIRTRQPLLIVEDTINRSRALGAIITNDQPALSWLGVPMILGEEIIGAIIVQDLENEHRFDQDDMRLLTTLSAQVGIAINSTRLIHTSQIRAKRDQTLFEITNKIRYSANIEEVLEITAEELSKFLNLKSTQIEISFENVPNE